MSTELHSPLHSPHTRIALCVSAQLPRGPVGVSITSDSSRTLSLESTAVERLTPLAMLLRSLTTCIRQGLEREVAGFGGLQMSGMIEAFASIDSRRLFGSRREGLERIDLRLDLDTRAEVARPLLLLSTQKSLVFRTLSSQAMIRLFVGEVELDSPAHFSTLRTAA